MVLSECIKEKPNNLLEALKSYNSLRKPIYFFYQNISRWTNPWYILFQFLLYFITDSEVKMNVPRIIFLEFSELSNDIHIVFEKNLIQL